MSEIASWARQVHALLDTIEGPLGQVHALGSPPTGDDPQEVVREISALWRRLGFTVDLDGRAMCARAADALCSRVSAQIPLALERLHSATLPVLNRAVADSANCSTNLYVAPAGLPFEILTPVAMGGLAPITAPAPVVMVPFDALPETHVLRHTLDRSEGWVHHKTNAPMCVLGLAVKVEEIWGQPAVWKPQPIYPTNQVAEMTRGWRSAQRVEERAADQKRAEYERVTQRANQPVTLEDRIERLERAGNAATRTDSEIPWGSKAPSWRG